jgi:hypothetical protein
MVWLPTLYVTVMAWLPTLYATVTIAQCMDVSQSIKAVSTTLHSRCKAGCCAVQLATQQGRLHVTACRELPTATILSRNAKAGMRKHFIKHPPKRCKYAAAALQAIAKSWLNRLDAHPLQMSMT